MNTLPSGSGGSSLTHDRGQYGVSHACTDNKTTNNVLGSSNTNFANVSNSYNHTINVGMSEESLRMQAWLSPLEPHARHQDVSNRRLDGVGDWVLQKDDFQEWCRSQDGTVNSTLLCYGDQGAGKTYISSLVIDTLCKQASRQNMAVLFLYCDYQAQKDQSAVNMIGSLLRQVALGGVGNVNEIRSAFEESKRGSGKGLRLPEMVELFVKTVGSIERVYICVDAIDELVPQHRSGFLRALRQLTEEAANMRLFLTGRPHIRGELDKHLTSEAYTIHIVPDQGDIARYLIQKMDEDDDQDPDLMTENLKADIMKTILERSSEMFLLVALNIDAILCETSISGRKEMLRRVATTGVDLDNVYNQTLRRIKEQKGDRSRLGVEVLMWVSHAERPLRIEELCNALAVKMGATDLDHENVRPQDTVLKSCFGLAVVDSETSTVRLIHYTLQEYLSRPEILPGAHRTLGETCLTYLNYDKVKGLPADTVSDFKNMPFLKYSSLHWGSHAKIELSDHAKSLALELLNRNGDHISSTLLLDNIQDMYSRSSGRRLFPGLHCASYFGVDEVVATLIQDGGCDINQSDGIGYTPLAWASREGNVGAVALLLTRSDVNPDKQDMRGRTPLLWASWNGRVGVVRLLLARDDVYPDKPDKNGRTPLSWASGNGRKRVVGLLLSRDDVDPNKLDNVGQTPLLWASWNGHEGVVRRLLARNGVDPNKPNNRGKVPLWWPSWSGHEGVVRLLLARGDVHPDEPNEDGLTPLWAACCEGHEGVVRLLLARDDVNPDMPTNYSKKPLWWASHEGHEGVVRLLLTRDEVNPDRPDDDGRTPLWCASRQGKEGIVRLLLARDDVNADRPDNSGQTPLGIASERGHGQIVALLYARTTPLSSTD